MFMYEDIKKFEVSFIKKSKNDYKNQEIIDLLSDSAIIYNDNFFECNLNNEKLTSYIQELKKINAKIRFLTVDNIYNSICNKVYL